MIPMHLVSFHKFSVNLKVRGEKSRKQFREASGLWNFGATVLTDLFTWVDTCKFRQTHRGCTHTYTHPLTHMCVIGSQA